MSRQIRKGIRTAGSLEQVRNQVLNRLYLIVLLLGALATAAAIVEEMMSGRWWVLLIYGAAYAIVVVGFLARGLVFDLRAWVLLTTLYAVGVIEFWFFGFSSMGFLFFYALVTFAALLFGRSRALAVLGASLATVALFAAFYAVGLIAPGNTTQHLSATLRFWLSPTATYLLLATMSVVFISMVLGELESSIAATAGYLSSLREEVRRRENLEAQLRHRQKMEAVGLLAGSVAHNFNNTIQAIRGLADLALFELESNAHAKRELQSIVDWTDQAGSLIRHLLAFSRSQPQEVEDISLDWAVEKSRPLIERVIGSDLEVRISNASGGAMVRVDAGGLEQLIMNLCLNARDAMEAGGTLTVETGSVELDERFCADAPWAAPGRYERLRVSDTGKGIPEAVLERIFEPFFTTKGPEEGTGLGLSTVYAFVRQHDGLINVESGEEIGTTFEIYFPRAVNRENA